MSGWRAWLPPLLAPLGGVLVWLAERIWPGTVASPYLAALGAALLVVALALHLPPFQEERGAGSLRGATGWLGAPYALFVLALALYYGSTLLRGHPAGMVDWRGLARAGWMLSLAAGAVLYVFVTLARLAQRRAPQPDARRIRLAGSAGLSLALLLVLVALLNFVFAGLPWEWNLAYFKTTRPSEATRELVQGLTTPVQVGAFFAADSEVGPLVHSYFDALKSSSDQADKLQIQFADADLQPALAETFKARGNGWVVLRKGALVRPMRVGEVLGQARFQLRNFDRNFFRTLLEVSRPPATVYLTIGHGERNERGGSATPGGSFNRFRVVMRERNYTVKDLGIGQGLGDRVPADAALVVIAAPTEPFLPSEAAALRHYLDGGGRLLAFLEPRTGPVPEHKGLPGVTLVQLLRDYGVEFDPTVQDNDRIYARRTYTRADHTLLVTVAYQNHPSVNNLRVASGQFPLVLLGAGALRIGQVPPGLTVQDTIKAMPGTWGDLNGNFEFDAAKEHRDTPALALAVAPKGAPEAQHAAAGAAPKTNGPTMLVFADADLASDLLIRNRANLTAVEDALGWLVEQDKPVGLPQTEEDVRIRHAKGDDWLWFYLPVLGVPFLLLGFGFWQAMRRRRRAGGGDA
ncbi:MAG TPA: Gldg family protein [bacterium]|nr:Gldg family protein [bacterium]